MSNRTMSDESKRDIEGMVGILMELDEKSLLIMNAGAQMLKARQDMDKDKSKELLEV